jgi:protein-S-isoprenylcysteine O-methyltransferase Ste14
MTSAPTTMTRSVKLLDGAMLALSAVLGVGSIALLGAMEWIRVLRTGWTAPGVFLWDAALSFAFFLQHSGMVRRPFRERLARTVPPRYVGTVYSIASGIVLTLVVLLWQRSEIRLFELRGVPFVLSRALSALAGAVFVWSAISLKGFDPLGLAPIRAHVRGRPDRPARFVVRGPYRWVRHPLYSCVILLIWSSPDMTADRLLFDVLWTAWICAGAVWEERDLTAQFGEAYRNYQRQVPMLVPWRGPAARWPEVASEAPTSRSRTT